MKKIRVNAPLHSIARMRAIQMSESKSDPSQRLQRRRSARKAAIARHRV